MKNYKGDAKPTKSKKTSANAKGKDNNMPFAVSPRWQTRDQESELERNLDLERHFALAFKFDDYLEDGRNSPHPNRLLQKLRVSGGNKNSKVPGTPLATCNVSMPGIEVDLRCDETMPAILKAVESSADTAADDERFPSPDYFHSDNDMDASFDDSDSESSRNEYRNGNVINYCYEHDPSRLNIAAYITSYKKGNMKSWWSNPLYTKYEKKWPGHPERGPCMKVDVSNSITALINLDNIPYNFLLEYCAFVEAANIRENDAEATISLPGGQATASTHATVRIAASDADDAEDSEPAVKRPRLNSEAMPTLKKKAKKPKDDKI